jgi:hypothetical protein
VAIRFDLLDHTHVGVILFREIGFGTLVFILLFFHLSRIRIGFSDMMHGLVGFYGFNSRFSKIAFFHRYFV